MLAAAQNAHQWSSQLWTHVAQKKTIFSLGSWKNSKQFSYNTQVLDGHWWLGAGHNCGYNVGGGRRFLDHSHPLCTKLHQAPSARVRGGLFVAVVREYTHTYLESRFGERGQQITVEMVDGRGSINTYLCINWYVFWLHKWRKEFKLNLLWSAPTLEQLNFKFSWTFSHLHSLGLIDVINNV